MESNETRFKGFTKRIKALLVTHYKAQVLFLIRHNVQKLSFIEPDVHDIFCSPDYELHITYKNLFHLFH